MPTTSNALRRRRPSLPRPPASGEKNFKASPTANTQSVEYDTTRHPREASLRFVHDRQGDHRMHYMQVRPLKLAQKRFVFC